MANTKQFSIHAIFKAIDEMSSPVRQMSSNVDSLKKNMKGIDKIAKTIFVGAAAAATAGALAIADFTKEAAKIEKYIVRLSTKFHGSTKEAGSLVNQIQILAAKTPLQFEPLIQATDYLLAYGVESKNVISTLRMLGDVAQGDNDKLLNIANAYGRIVAEDRVTRKRLQPLVTSGVPIYQALSNVMGISQRQLSMAMQRGTVGAKELNKAITLLTSSGGMFYQNMEKQSQTLIGRFSTFKDLIIILKITLGKIFTPVAKDALEYLIKTVEEMTSLAEKTFAPIKSIDKFGNVIETANPKVREIQDSLKGFLETIKSIIIFSLNFIKTTYGVYNALKPIHPLMLALVIVFGSLYLGLKAYIGVLSFINALQKANIVISTILHGKTIAQVAVQGAMNTVMLVSNGITKALTIAQWAFNAALSANPVGAVILLIVGLITVFVFLYNNCEVVRNAVDFLWKNFVEGIKIAKKIFTDVVGSIIAYWNQVVAVFKSGDIVAILLTIAKGIIGYILAPINLLLTALSYLPGEAGKSVKAAKEKLNSLTTGGIDQIINARLEGKKAQNGKVDVSFSNVPSGTKVSSRGEALGAVELNTGRA